MKELTIEQKAKAYDKALEKAKRLYEQGTITESLCYVFPELKESEDEKMRKGIIRNLEYLMDRAEGFVKDELKERIAWLEKQGEQKPTDKVNPKFHEGDWIVWENQYYKVNYNGCGYELVDQNGLKTSLEYGTIDESAHLWDITKDAKDGDVLYSLDSNQPFIYQKRNVHEQATAYCGINKYGKFFVWNTKDCIIALDKYVPATKEQRDALMKAMTDAGYEWDADKKELKKTELHNSYKLEPNFDFSVGQWIVVPIAKKVFLITKIEGFGITLVDIDGDEYVFGVDSLKDARLWTVADAKEGDVLSNGKMIVLFKHFEEPSYKQHIVAYIGLDAIGAIQITDDAWYLGIGKTYPATKEQRELLFQKMKKAGYEWDAENKELKKIEPKFKAGNWYQCTKDFFGKGVTFDKNTAYYCAKEGCLQCEYGCHIAIVKDLYDNFKLWTISDAKDGDVLYSLDSNQPFIYQKRNVHEQATAYCGINKYGKFFVWNTKDCIITLDKYIPATKSQRDTLLKAMADAGWEFDFEKKELKKIESNSAWSEEDDAYQSFAISAVEEYYDAKNSIQRGLIDWLKSLKQRIGG